MDNMKVVYKVLAEVDKQMDNIDFDESFIKNLKVSDNRINKIIESLVEDGYLTGIKISKSKTGNIVMFINPRLTIKGMEFLQENSTMQKIKNGLKDVKDITPFI
ncbi:YjcQ protein [Peptostreptococcus anaerobius]|uniref:YjcQ protein n=3 Tax=Peptostreptococcus anaerobius TaxID=1261 RepID=A0A379CDE1_9FIRM|nr:YjcQ family protein [Peptostreptococcus anaerobius]SFM95975.1 YjcQ protein [Peptostreptococcus anaerobius]SUB60442.1 YjcQ protein [Peptostreptococcus anaerobius]